MNILKSILDLDDIKFYIFNSKESIVAYADEFRDLDYSRIRDDEYISVVKYKKIYSYLFKYKYDVYVMLHTYNTNDLLTIEKIDTIYSYFIEFYDLRGKESLKRKENIDFGNYIDVYDERDRAMEIILKSLLLVMDQGDVGYIQIYKPELDALITKYVVGGGDFYKMETGLDNSIAGQVFKTGRSLVYNSREEILREGSSKSIHEVEKLSGERIQKIISVPIRIGQESIGSLTFQQFHERGDFKESDVEIMEGFSEQIAYRLRNRELLGHFKAGLANISDLNIELDKRNKLLAKKNEIYLKLIALSVENKGMDVILENLYRELDMPFVYLDSIYKKVLFNKLDPGGDEGFLRETARLEEGEKLIESRGGDYYAYPIKSSIMNFGYFIIDEDIDANSPEYLLIESGIMVLTMEAIREYGKTDLIYNEIYTNFNRFLSASSLGDMRRYGEGLGLAEDKYYTSVLVDFNGYSDNFTLEKNVYQSLYYINQKLRNRDVLIYGLHNTIHILDYTSGLEGKDRLELLVGDIFKRMDLDEGIYLSVGIGSSYLGYEGIKKTYDEANKTVRYLAKKDYTSVKSYGDVGIDKLFISMEERSVDEFIDESIGRLRRENEELERTLYTYIKNDKGIKETADQLFIHRNTLYKRLKSIEEILDMDLSRSEDSLKISLAYYLKYNN